MLDGRWSIVDGQLSMSEGSGPGLNDGTTKVSKKVASMALVALVGLRGMCKCETTVSAVTKGVVPAELQTAASHRQRPGSYKSAVAVRRGMTASSTAHSVSSFAHPPPPIAHRLSPILPHPPHIAHRPSSVRHRPSHNVHRPYSFAYRSFSCEKFSKMGSFGCVIDRCRRRPSPTWWGLTWASRLSFE